MTSKPLGTAVCETDFESVNSWGRWRTADQLETPRYGMLESLCVGPRSAGGRCRALPAIPPNHVSASL